MTPLATGMKVRVFQWILKCRFEQRANEQDLGIEEAYSLRLSSGNIPPVFVVGRKHPIEPGQVYSRHT
jgi:hypothetical protein